MLLQATIPYFIIYVLSMNLAKVQKTGKMTENFSKGFWILEYGFIEFL